MEVVFYTVDKEHYFLDKNFVSLKTLMHILVEAHRFGITFHRQLREKPLTKSVLNEIKGIGVKSERQLIVHFKSVENIKTASLAELIAAIGMAKARIVYDYFHSSAE